MAKNKSKEGAGRPPIFRDEDVIFVKTNKAGSKLQKDSKRRAIINRLIDAGGSQTIAELNEHFGFDVRQAVRALVRGHWLSKGE